MPRGPIRIGVQIMPQHADYAQIRRACAVLMNPQDDVAEVERWVAWRDRRNA